MYIADSDTSETYSATGYLQHLIARYAVAGSAGVTASRERDRGLAPLSCPLLPQSN